MRGWVGGEGRESGRTGGSGNWDWCVKSERVGFFQNDN